MLCLANLAQRSVYGFQIDVPVPVVEALSQIRRSGIGRPTHLRTEFVDLELRKAQRKLVNLQMQINQSPVNLQISNPRYLSYEPFLSKYRGILL